MKSFDSIQQLRAVAILLVFFYHSYVVIKKYYHVNQENALYYFSHSGMIGVILFFVISGFIMAYILDRGEKNFLLKRFFRIYPVYFFAVVLVVFLKVFFFGAIKENYLPYAMTLLPLEIMKPTLLVMPSYPLGIEWTLIFEIFFYMTISIFNDNKRKKYLLLYSASWLMIILIEYFRSNTPLSTRVDYKEIFFSLYNIPFILGILTYSIYLKIEKYRKTVYTAFYYMFFLIFVYLSNLYINYEQSQFFRVIVISLSGLLLIILSLLTKNEDNMFLDKILINIGNYSFGIYLLHLAILDIMFSIFYNKLHISISFAIIILSIAFLLSMLYGRLDVYWHKQIKLKLNNRRNNV